MKKQLFLLGTVFVSAVWLLFQVDVSGPTLFLPGHNIAPAKWPAFLINTKGCRIQNLRLFDDLVTAYVHYEEPPRCDPNSTGNLVEADLDSLYINKNVLHNYNLTSVKDVECEYCEFWRVEHAPNKKNEYEYDVDTQARYSNICVPIIDRAFVKEEFVKVVCRHSEEGGDIFNDYFAFPQVNKVKVVRKNEGREAVSVLVVGVDAVSRLNLYRQMPQVITFLKDNTLIFEMLGYNKVGDNTYPNLVPVLSGLSEHELEKKCWPSTKAVFDECPFVWKKYKKYGYYTAFAEDSANIGLFNYIKRGFRKQPTDFYGQIFNLAAESQLGHDKRLNTKLCIGKRINIDVLLQLTKRFVLNLKKYLSFSFFWSTSLTHDYLNLPYYGDVPYLTFFKALYEENIFEKSVVIFMSDHGIRWGGIRHTYQGYMEERLPFLFVALPRWFIESFPMAVRNLATNKRRLTTPYDLHETLKDLMDLRNLKDRRIKYREKKERKNRGISLFLNIPEDRTCDDAGVSDNWCTCHTSRPVSTNNSMVISAVNATVTHINQLLKSYKQCAILKLQKILNARIEEVPINRKKEGHLQQLTDYSVSLETVPGSGVFEATVRYNNATKQFTVMEPISRINTYGNQSICISHYLLKLYCYCLNNWGRGT